MDQKQSVHRSNTKLVETTIVGVCCMNVAPESVLQHKLNVLAYANTTEGSLDVPLIIGFRPTRLAATLHWP